MNAVSAHYKFLTIMKEKISVIKSYYEQKINKMAVM